LKQFLFHPSGILARFLYHMAKSGPFSKALSSALLKSPVRSNPLLLGNPVIFLVNLFWG
jgi:hypothetical protein